MRSLLLLLSLGFAVAAHADTASGRVFLDENRNGLLDAGEQGIAGVRVSLKSALAGGSSCKYRAHGSAVTCSKRWVRR